MKADFTFEGKMEFDSELPEEVMNEYEKMKCSRGILPKIEALNPTQIPLSEFENNLDKIDLEKEKIIFCQVGIRSKTAVSILQKHNINNSYSVKEGALEIVAYMKQLQKQY